MGRKARKRNSIKRRGFDPLDPKRGIGISAIPRPEWKKSPSAVLGVDKVRDMLHYAVEDATSEGGTNYLSEALDEYVREAGAAGVLELVKMLDQIRDLPDCTDDDLKLISVVMARLLTISRIVQAEQRAAIEPSPSYAQMLDWIGQTIEHLRSPALEAKLIRQQAEAGIRVDADLLREIRECVRSAWVTLKLAAPFYVSGEPCELIGVAAAALPEDSKLHRDMLPEPLGVLWLEKQIPFQGKMLDVRGEYVGEAPRRMVNCRAIAWASQVCPECSPDYELQAVDELVTFALGTPCRIPSCPCTACGIEFHIFGHEDGGSFSKTMPWMNEDERPYCCEHWETCEDFALIQPLRAFFLAALGFMDQKIAAAEPLHIDRSARRRYERVSGRSEQKYSVIHLRRRERASGDSPSDRGPVKWSHRWTVPAHWHRYWYSSIGQHRDRWVGDYVKGPESLPLVLTGRKSIYGVVR